MSITTRARLPRIALAATTGLTVLVACDDVTGPRDDLTGPGDDLGIASQISPALLGVDVVPITPTGLSTTDIPVLVLPEQINGSNFTSSMSAISESNWVVGTATIGSDKAVLWRGGDFELIWGASEPRPTRGFGLNGSGMVVGEWVSSTGPAVAFRWSDGAAPVLLPTPPVLATGADSEARDVDDDGDIVVFYGRNTSTACPEGSNITGATAVLVSPYASSVNYTLVPPPVCQTHVDGQAIDEGKVVGRLTTPGGVSEAFLWDGGAAVQTLGDWYAADIEGVYAVGRRLISGAFMAVRAEPPAEPQDLGTLGGVTSEARGVNNLGWVVGSSTTASGETHAFLWTPEQGMIDLGTVGGTFSRARDINDAGYIVGDANNAAGRRVAVIWYYAPNQPPEMEAIISQVVTVGNELVVTPVVTDPESDPFTIAWSGEVPPNAAINGVFTWTPTVDQVGDYTVTVTATQDDNPGLFDSETFLISVLPAQVLSADLQVSVGPSLPQQQLVGDAVGYLASVYNAGPDAVSADLTVALEYRDQADWGTIPPEAAINGVFFIEVGEIGPDETVEVPFEVVYGAFGVQGVTATVAGDFDEVRPDDNEGVFDQVIDLALGTPGVIATGLDIGGESTFDGEPLAVVGLHVPAELIAGVPGDLFVPVALTPQGTLIPLPDSWDPALSFIPEPDEWEARDVFIPEPDSWLPGQVFIPSPDSWLPGHVFIPEPDQWLSGQVFIPSPDDWDPAGRLLFARGATDLLMGDRAGTTLALGAGAGPGLAVGVGGGAMDANLGLCGAQFSAFMGHADEAEFACGSLTTTVLTGEVSIVLADGTRVDVAAGAEVRIGEDGLGGWDIEVVAGDPNDVVVTPPVTNGTPVAVPGGPYVGAVGQLLTLDGSGSTDPDGDPLTYEWRLDDGGVSGITAMGVNTSIVVPLVPGLYLLRLTVTDPDGAMSTASVEVAVYDPEGSSVTGGGWFNSPAGALVANPTAEGKASVAFHVAYRKGRSTPDGHARLTFQAGNLRLDSEFFDWLVVGGEMARFRGIGDLEGRAAPVSFEVVARDPDQIQVRIWDDSGDIYDSGEVYLGGGRIVIED